MTINPTLAYRVTDRLSIGGGPQVWYGDVEFRLPAVSADAGTRH